MTRRDAKGGEFLTPLRSATKLMEGRALTRPWGRGRDGARPLAHLAPSLLL